MRSHPLYWQYELAHGGPKVAIRDGDWKLLAMADLKTFELYDLRNDVSESTNLAGAQPQRTSSSWPSN